MVAWGRGPHWLLNDDDAKKYGVALANAARHLPVQATQKAVDFTMLAVAVATFDGPRVALDMQLRAQRQAQARQPSHGSPVFAFVPPASGPPRPAPAQSNPTSPLHPTAATSGAQPPPPQEAPMTYEPELDAA